MELNTTDELFQQTINDNAKIIEGKYCAMFQPTDEETFSDNLKFRPLFESDHKIVLKNPPENNNLKKIKIETDNSIDTISVNNMEENHTKDEKLSIPENLSSLSNNKKDSYTDISPCKTTANDILEETDTLMSEMDEEISQNSPQVPTDFDTTTSEQDNTLKVGNILDSTAYQVALNAYNKPIKVNTLDVSSLGTPNRYNEFSGEKNFKCKICHKSFTQIGSLNRHIMSHTGAKPHPCSICDKAFKTASILKDHMQRHTGERLYPCCICDKAFTGSSNLQRHTRTHTGDKPHACYVCEKTFKSGAELKRHLWIHTEVFPYQCSMCKKGFNEVGHLTKHMRVHTREKPYSCPTCDKSFADPGYLKGHMRVHSGEAPYKCTICGKGSKFPGNLKKHMRSHSTEKPYKCTVCDKAFKVAVSLQKHLLTHEENSVFIPTTNPLGDTLDDTDSTVLESSEAINDNTDNSISVPTIPISLEDANSSMFLSAASIYDYSEGLLPLAEDKTTLLENN